MVPHFLDETMAQGQFVPSVNPALTQKKKPHDFLLAHLFFFDSHNLHYLSIKIKCCKNNNNNKIITRRDPCM
jgi:hypothetical protein